MPGPGLDAANDIVSKTGNSSILELTVLNRKTKKLIKKNSL